MDFPEGITHMNKLMLDLKEKKKEKDSFKVGALTISYPGFKTTLKKILDY